MASSFPRFLTRQIPERRKNARFLKPEILYAIIFLRCRIRFPLWVASESVGRYLARDNYRDFSEIHTLSPAFLSFQCSSRIIELHNSPVLLHLSCYSLRMRAPLLVKTLPYHGTCLPERPNGGFFRVNRDYFLSFWKKNLLLSDKQPLLKRKRISSVVQNNLCRKAK